MQVYSYVAFEYQHYSPAAGGIVMMDKDRTISILNKVKIFIAHSIFQYIPHIDYHPMDIAALIYYANTLDITVPPKVKKRTREFLSREIGQNYGEMPIREILWGVSYLLMEGYTLEELSDPIKHVFSFQNRNGGIGFYRGDVSRIPSTGWLLSTILSEKFKNDALYVTQKEAILKAANFLVDEWTKDVSLGHALAYKGAYVLSSLLGCRIVDLNAHDADRTIRHTLEILLNMQIENGSWTFLLKQSNSRISVALSSPYITSQVMLSLCRAHQSERIHTANILTKDQLEMVLGTVDKGAEYLCETQHELGFWYAHNAGELAVINGQCALALKEALEVLPR